MASYAGVMRQTRSLTPQIMGVLNITPDSFSDGGLHSSAESAVQHGEMLIADGAAIIDIGGEATGPGSAPCSADTEWGRISLAVESLATRYSVSVDTYKSTIAERALRVGAKIINDISGLRHDHAMAAIVREHGASVVIMFSKEAGARPHVSDLPGNYTNVLSAISDFFSERIDYALAAGLAEAQIILDPGLGRYISEHAEYSWEILGGLANLRQKFPRNRFLIGASRKGFLGGALRDRDPISQLVGIHAALSGADVIRTHNVRMAADFFAVWNRLTERR